MFCGSKLQVYAQVRNIYSKFVCVCIYICIYVYLSICKLFFSRTIQNSQIAQKLNENDDRKIKEGERRREKKEKKEKKEKNKKNKNKKIRK